MDESRRKDRSRCIRWRGVVGRCRCCWVKQKWMSMPKLPTLVPFFSCLMLKIHVWQRCWTLDFPVEVIFGERTRKLSSTQLSHLIYLRYSWKVLPWLLVSGCPRTGRTSGSPGAPNHSPHTHMRTHMRSRVTLDHRSIFPTMNITARGNGCNYKYWKRREGTFELHPAGTSGTKPTARWCCGIIVLSKVYKWSLHFTVSPGVVRCNSMGV